MSFGQSQRSRRFLACLCALGAMICAPVSAQTDTTFTYQGSLDDQGAAANGSFNLDFALFDALSGGSQVGSTIVMNGVPVTDGLLTAELDFGTSAFDNTSRWLEIAVNGSTLIPRQPISRSPYSIQTRGIFVDANFNVGIGTSAPSSPLHVESDDTAIFGHATASSGFTRGVYGKSSSTSGRGVYGFATGFLGSGTSFGVYGENSSASGRGVYGIATSTSGTNYGGRFQSDSASGHGVFAEATASIGPTRGVHGLSRSTTGYGVLGVANATSGSAYGVYGLSHSTSGRGIFGWAFANSGTTYGGYFENESTSGRGVFGLADAFTGITYGGRFETNSTTGRGVFGLAKRTSGINYGGRFESKSTSGQGVLGYVSALSGLTYAVRGHCSSSGGYDFFASGPGQNYGSSSSRRWKSNIEPISDPLSKLAQLRGVYFDWDDEHGGQHDVGMIAEEVGAVMPEIVQYEENGIDAIGMDYSKMTPLLVEAVNALRSEKDRDITTMREAHAAEISDLREQLSDLQQIVERLASNQEKESAQ